MVYRFLAYLTVSLHVAFIAFAILGGLAMYRWGWVIWLHIPTVVYALLIQIVGMRCPLTDLEKWLRGLAGQQVYSGGFLPHYVWHPLGLTGREPSIAVGLLIVIIIVNAHPYLTWAAA